MNWFRDPQTWVIAAIILLIAIACFGPMMHHWKPDATYAMPVTKGDVYLCTAMIILFGRK